MNNPFRIGERIYLRPVERDDAPLFVAWLNDPEVTETLAMYRPINLATEEGFIAGVYKSEHDVVLGIVAKGDDQLVGVTGLHNIDWKNRQASFGISIGVKGEWDKGYGGEATRLMVGFAFETLNLHRVWLHVYDGNARAMHVYEQVGFCREGILRQARFHAGRYWDTITMAILADEWRASA